LHDDVDVVTTNPKILCKYSPLFTGKSQKRFQPNERGKDGYECLEKEE
jgi:hypothetical protein